MSVTRQGDLIRLDGQCRVEDAEVLTGMLQAAPQASLDLSACVELHTAVLQVILAFAPTIQLAPEAGGFLATHLAPILAQVERGAPVPNVSAPSGLQI